MRFACTVIVIVGLLLAAATANAAGGTIRRGHYFSKALGVDKYYFVYLPRSYTHAAKRRYPVVILLHGYGNTAAE